MEHTDYSWQAKKNERKMPQVEDLEDGIKYDQNALYKILKGLIKNALK